MATSKARFRGANGDLLAAALELPDTPGGWRYSAIFAHCFTCGKDSLAATRISRALAAEGILVLRFDFTGLGGSEGDFANAGFSSNVDDLICAADWLATEYGLAPSLLIGHSLGGAAVLNAAGRLESVEAVATIAAPAQGDHLLRTLGRDVDLDAVADRVDLELGGRRFPIGRAFLDDLRNATDIEAVRRIGAALLILHSPLDEIVDISEAARIYAAAIHPKSFVSLDRADHLLTGRDDSAYVAATIAVWARRYLASPAVEPAPAADRSPLASGEVWIGEGNQSFLRRMRAGRHEVLADEPIDLGGGGAGPTPYDLLLMALGACTSMTLRQYARRKQIPLDDVQMVLRHQRVHMADCDVGCEGGEGRMERITRRIRLSGGLTDAQRADLLRVADRCPVHRTLTSGPEIGKVDDGG